MKKVVLLVLVVLLLIGGGLGVMTYLGQGPVADYLKKTAKKEEPPPAPPPLPTAVYDLGSFIVPLIKDHAIGKQIGMDIEVEVDGKVSAKVNQELPRLQNAFTVELFDSIPRHADVHSASDKKAIREKLAVIGNKMFGEGAIHDVVIKSMYDR